MKYKAIKKGQANEQIYHTGDVFEFDGVPGSWMEPMDAAAKAAFEKQFPEKAPKKQDLKKEEIKK